MAADLPPSNPMERPPQGSPGSAAAVPGLGGAAPLAPTPVQSVDELEAEAVRELMNNQLNWSGIARWAVFLPAFAFLLRDSLPGGAAVKSAVIFLYAGAIIIYLGMNRRRWRQECEELGLNPAQSKELSRRLRRGIRESRHKRRGWMRTRARVNAVIEDYTQPDGRLRLPE